MKSIAIDFELPAPWSGGKRFQTRQVGALNFLLGPNGTGKSRFAASLRHHLPHCRLLGTDRLTALHKESGSGIWGSHFESGFPKRDFDRLKRASIEGEFGVDSFLLLEEKLNLRMTIRGYSKFPIWPRNHSRMGLRQLGSKGFAQGRREPI